MSVFLTKKQKAQMKERRKKLALSKYDDNDDNNDNGDDSAARRKRKHDEKEEPVTQSEQPASSTLKESTVIVVPAELTGKDARRFRKEARRKAKVQGLDPETLQFVIEGQEQQQDERVTEPPSKKKKKTFPCINDLLKQQQEEAAKQKEVEARQKAEDRIPEDVKSKYVAVDCEMVGIGADGKQSALARVSVVDWHGAVLLDTFVQVPSRVTDFRTFVSGVTAKSIQSKTAMDVIECRKRVAALLHHKVLVGHALKNDLDALLLNHPKVDIRDTAKYRPFQRSSGANGGKWRPRKLRDLVKEHVGMIIQVPGESHDSIDDAKATMELFKKVRVAWEKELEKKASGGTGTGRKQKK